MGCNLIHILTVYVSNGTHSKVQTSFEGCYNYNKLKSEGLVDEETLDDEIIRVHITENDDGC